MLKHTQPKPTKHHASQEKSSGSDKQIKSLESSLARALADYVNLERRFAQQSSAVIKFGKADLLTKILDLRDHLFMATQTLKDQSLTMILGSLDKILADEGVVEIDATGPYDPTSMECQELGAGPKDQVIKVLRPGYRLHDRVIRTARVVVGSGDPAPAAAKGQVGTPKAEGVSL